MDVHGRFDADLPLLALLQRGVRRLSEELPVRLAAAGVDPITPAHAMVLAHLGGDAALNVAELARLAGVTRQTMHRAVGQLLDEGLVVSTPGPGFPRSTLIALTDAGRRRHEVATGVLRELEEDLERRLGAPALEALRDTLARAWPR
ncbi:MarR family winged helix-turn-helix transcriptional regulator (plasmid) [Streptomyces sp. BI20]|uniref:MarR family winged helix-turn-helix transcriptional regulator n=1 Tax=Streptomyces sp. BI20 TaxID=3403460 RepID=UPI003C716CE6